MKKYLFKENFVLASLMVFFPLSIYSQDLSEAFLQSLPSDIATDIKKASPSSEEDKNLMNPDTRIRLLESELELAEQSLEKIRRDLESEEPRSELSRFGESFFNSYQSTYLPLNQINLSGDYILDYGDYLNIQIIGQKNELHELPVNRDGTINLEDVGIIFVAGLSLESAKNLINQKVSEALLGSVSFVTLSKLRDMNLLIVGNVKFPGMYTMSGGSTILSLIYAAGGIDENGTYRAIQHKRNNEIIQVIDLYEILINGNLNFKNLPRSGDAFVVIPKGPEIRVSGSFARPAIYESKTTETLQTILNNAGMKQAHANDHVNLTRLNGDSIQNIKVPLNQLDQYTVNDGDAIELTSTVPIFPNTVSVEITGAINIPGIYNLDKDTKLSTLIDKAGGYTEAAYPLGGVFLRESIKNLELEFKEKSFASLVNFISSSQGNGGNIFSSSTNTEDLLMLINLMRSFEPTGRLITEFNTGNLKKDPVKDRELRDGDRIHIPYFLNEIFIFGEVMNPGAYPYNSQLKIEDYISKSGGSSRFADQSRITIILPNGETLRNYSSISDFLKKEPYILPGSTIYVPRYIGKVDGINLAANIAPIISSLALSIASLNSINN